MAQQTINIGSAPNDGTGDPIRDAFDKCNDNFTELYADDAALGTVAVLDVDTDGTLAANSDVLVPSQKAVKTAIASAVVGLFDPKGATDCSANPNYPAALKGDVYLVSVAGKIGGASGKPVTAGDLYIAFADNAGGTEASVGASWQVVQANITYVPVNIAGDTMTGDLIVPDEAYDATAWNGSLEVPTKNAVRDKIEAVLAGSGSVSDAAYGAGWDGDTTTAPSKNAVYDKIEALGGGGFTAASTTEQLTGTDTTKGTTSDSVAALWEQGADVASAGTTSLGEGGYFNITGTTTITDIDFATDKAGRKAWVKFAGILTLTHNASTLILPTAANITTAAGDTACFISEGSDVVRCVSYNRASGAALAGSASATSFFAMPTGVSYASNDGGSFATLGNIIYLAEAITVSDLIGTWNNDTIGNIYSMFIATVDASSNITGLVATATSPFTTLATGFQQKKFAISPTVLSASTRYYIGLVRTNGTGTSLCKAVVHTSALMANYPNLPLDLGLSGAFNCRAWYAQNSASPTSVSPSGTSGTTIYGVGLKFSY